MTPPFLTAPRLAEAGLAHGFFGREGGVSERIFTSLNTGLGSIDKPERVQENRRRCREALRAEHLLTLYQVHSPTIIHIEKPFDSEAPKADAMVTTTPRIALGVLAADCMPFLFADPNAGVIGAAHAGWRGALAGVLEETVKAMTALGAKPERIIAALGPSLRQKNFEVGLDLVQAFTEKHPSAEKFFAAGASPEKRQLDLAGFGRWRLAESGVEMMDDLGVCTINAAEHYFSYRMSRRRGEPDYGRNLSAIALA
ncbi:MAG: peptidoglycan editing factor PgeF [Parvularculaceae bacterium]